MQGEKSFVSGLSRTDATALAEALEKAWAGRWRRSLAAKIGELRSLHDRVVRLEDPPRYVSLDSIRELTRDAERVAGHLAGRWPNALSQAPEVLKLMSVLEFLEEPDKDRAKANETFVTSELVRSQNFLDRIEARPLTGEQRRAVIVDEQRNLVVAAAGSGKTSVIVAKAAWLIRKGYRRPRELLLLARISHQRGVHGAETRGTSKKYNPLQAMTEPPHAHRLYLDAIGV